MSETRPAYQRGSGAAFASRIERDCAHRAKSRSLKPLRHIWPFIAHYPLWLGLFLLFLFLSSIATLIIPTIARLIVDCGFAGSSAVQPDFCTRIDVSGAGDLTSYFRIALVFALVYSVVGPLRAFFITTLGQRVIADIRSTVYSHLLTLSPAYFERMRTGEVLSRLTTDTTLIETVVTGSISFGIRAVAIALGAVIMMFVTNWKMALMVLAIGPLIIIPVIVFGRMIRNLSRDGQDSLADASARAGESLPAIETVQAFNRESYENSVFTGIVNATFDIHRKRIFVRTILSTLIFAVALCAVIGILWYGAIQVNTGQMTGGDILQFTLYAFLVLSNLGFLTETWTNLLRASGASERLVDILQATPTIIAPANPKVPETASLIEFETVGFSYPSRPDDAVIDNLNFTIHAGETVAIVGPSGAGKSTLFQLMLRFYDVQTGQIKLGHVPIRDMDPAALRSHFAIVQQATPLFSGSAMDNVRYGRLDASDEEVIAAARDAFAHDFIVKLPDGYDTDLGERATTLSGGQRQRIAIARAILHDAPILLLDEATSALDAESERTVQTAFEKLSKNRTTIIIAHRLATVKKADRIIVMDEGRIVGEGTHDDLIRQDGIYARLAELQFT
ncbi:MAG: ATP-binding cassette domain-containing protein [Hyphomonadaceae bacterium]|nr:ATP-binding cassette domain-containing protein [Hyphomonadaceae bacterium]